MKSLLISVGFLTIIILHLGVNGIPTPANTKTDIKQQEKESTAEDDSDMLMEPDEILGPAISERSIFYPSTAPGIQVEQRFRPITGISEFANLEQTSPQAPEIPTPAAQNYFPSFFRDTQPLGHSRPYYPIQQQEQQSARFNNINGNRGYDPTLLGSGDFGVIRGGTFYQDNDIPYRGGDNNDYYNYYNNGHGGRPQVSPLVQRFTYPEEQFANFRDFADINTGGEAAFSHFVVVYANKNSTTSHHPNPKNIFEQLQLLDKENENNNKKLTKKVTSKSKTKLAGSKYEKKYKKKIWPKDTEVEPLLALS